MNSLKTVLLVVFGAALVYMVYVGINNNPGNYDPEAALPPLVEMPGANSPAPPYSAGTAGSGVVSGFASGGPGVARTAPPPAANDTDPPPAANTYAPPFAAARSAVPESVRPPTAGVDDVRASSYLSGTHAEASPPQGAMARPPAAASGQPSAGTPDKPEPRSDPLGISGGLPLGAEPATAFATDGARRFRSFMEAVQAKLDEGRLDEAHEMLSPKHNDPELSPRQAQEVAQLLDQLAGTVIYSRQHWLEDEPYKVVQGDTLEQIARQYNVPGDLLAKINGIRDPQDLRPGRELKVVRGPFDAMISLKRLELTLTLNRRYAGRFPIGVARDLAQLEGSYRVLSKTKNPTYYYGDNQCIDADDPDNPLGEHLLGLDKDMVIHGTNDPANIGRVTDQGWISLGARDIEDLYGILSIGSRVTIRR